MAFDSILRRTIPKTATVERPGTEDARRAIENGLAEFVKVTQELAELRSEHDRALKICTKATAEITRLHEELADLKSRCTTYQIERDESVAKYAKLQAFLIALYAQMRAFDVPVISPNHFAVDPKAEHTNAPPSSSQDYLNTTKAIGDFSVRKDWNSKEETVS
jgi:chaperonin cofactor prefoldin